MLPFNSLYISVNFRLCLKITEEKNCSHGIPLQATLQLFFNMCCSKGQTRKVLDASAVLLPWHSPTCSVVTASRCAFTDWQFSCELQLHTCSFPASSVRSITLSLRLTLYVETDARHGQLNLALTHRYLPEPVTMKPSPSGIKHRLETALNV